MPGRIPPTCAESDDADIRVTQIASPDEALEIAYAELATFPLRFATQNTLPSCVRTIVDIRQDFVTESIKRGFGTPSIQPELSVVRGGVRRRVHALTVQDLPKDIPDLGLDPHATVYSVLEEKMRRGDIVDQNIAHAYFDARGKFLTDYPLPARR